MSTTQSHQAPEDSSLWQSNAPPGGQDKHRTQLSWLGSFFISWNDFIFPLFIYNLIIHSIEVGKEALMVPPASVRYLGTDVTRVWSAEALLVMVPTERVLDCTTES